MSKLKSLTENRYTLNDIFINNSEIWLCLPAFCFIIAHFVHIVVFSVLYKVPNEIDDFTHLLSVGEYPGDYLISIIHFVTLFSALLAFIGVISNIVSNKSSIKHNFSDNIPILFFISFVVLMIISVILNGINNDLLFGYTSRGEGFVSLLAYILIFYFCTSLIRKEKYKYVIIYSVISVGTTVGILAIVEEFFYNIPMLTYEGVCSIYYNINFYGYFLTILIMLTAALVLFDENKKRRVFAFIMFIMNTFILAINGTLGCFLACLVAFIFFIVSASLKNHKFNKGSLALFGIFLLINFATSFWYESYFTQLLGLVFDLKLIITDDEDAWKAGTLRWQLWTNTARYIREKPWIGYGFEGIAERLAEDTNQDKVHNEYLEYIADFGIPAGVLYVLGLISIYVKALIRREKVDNATFCCLVGAFGYIGSAFFGNTMVFIAPFFFIILGLANTTDNKKELAPVEITNVEAAEPLPEEPDETENSTEEAIQKTVCDE